MFIRRNNARAFTLLEVIIAVVIVSMIMVSVYRFVRVTLSAIATSRTVSEDRQEITGLINFLQAQLEEIPARYPAALLGNPNMFKNLAADEMQWLCRAGHGVLTTSGPDEYRVTLAIQPVASSPGELEIGLRRQPTSVDARIYKWLPLMRPAAALEIRYYDKRLNTWVERWTDVGQRPPLVRVRVWRNADEPPVEAILEVPSARST